MGTKGKTDMRTNHRTGKSDNRGGRSYWTYHLYLPGLKHEARKERRGADRAACRDVVRGVDPDSIRLSAPRCGNSWHWD